MVAMSGFALFFMTGRAGVAVDPTVMGGSADRWNLPIAG
jgi:hypothetical protein